MRAFSLLLIFTTLLVSACSSIGDSSKNLDEVENTPLSSTSAVTETPRVNLETSASPTIEPTIFPSPIDAQGEIAQPPIATSVERLSQASPWLIYMKGYESASITNSDGSGLFALPYEVSGAVVPPYDASNENPLLAVISDDSIFKDPPVLIIVSFPEMEVIQEIALQSCDLLHPGCIPDEEADVYFQPKWSPDGRYVAFVGAIDGPSSDLYLYDSLSNSIRRLTTGENQVGNFFWSPDSRWVVHEEVSHFNGWVVEAMWAASSVNDEVRWLYSPSTKYGQELLGWIDSDRFITFEHSWDGDSNLRLVSIRNGTGPSLFPGYFFEPFLDPDTGTVAFAPLLGAPNTNIAEPGIYLVSIRSTTPRRVPIDDINMGFLASLQRAQ